MDNRSSRSSRREGRRDARLVVADAFRALAAAAQLRHVLRHRQAGAEDGRVPARVSERGGGEGER